MSTTQAQAAQPLFYKNVVPLNREQHGDSFIEALEGYGFTDATNCVYIAAVEFGQAAAEYPIVFGDDNGSPFPVALLGLQENQNLYLAQDGNWQHARYIPAYIRRYPFILASEDSKSYTVCVDEEYPGLNKEARGERLFTDDGKNSALLDNSVAFLQDYQAHTERTAEFCEHLKKLDLLETMQANIETPDGKKYALAGFSVVNRERLKKLKQTQVFALFKKDELELIHYHLLSMNNLNKFMERL